MPGPEEQKEQCQSCGKFFPLSEIFFGPDPFAQEIYGDDTEIWLCEKCLEESASDI